jgi:outer membrane lipoprotein-sorting protein
MFRRALLAAPLLAAPGLALAQAGRGRADPAVVQRVEAYFNGLTTLRARFTQVAENGATAQGTALIWRPSRMRFDYDPPEPTLLVAADNQFFHYDRALREPTVVPVNSTPLGVLLRNPLRLSGDVTVTETERGGGLMRVTVRRTASPEEGSITLILDDDPPALRQWAVLDAQGRTTRVTLHNVELGVRLDPFQFQFNNPRFREELEQGR